MSQPIVEHINLTVAEPLALAERLCQLFDWHIRWQGESIHNGYTVHVGGDDSYLALYSPPAFKNPPTEPYFADRALNHIGLLVEDLERRKQRVLAHGIEIYNDNETPPGRRFYFMLHEVEFEVVQY